MIFLNRTQSALEDLIIAASVSMSGSRDNLPAAIAAARAVASKPLKVKTLNWREIDPERSYVGTGHGFTCEVRLMHSGMWETVLPTGKIDTISCSGGMLAAQSAYNAMIWDCFD